MIVLNLFLWMWSHCPFFSLTDDELFATLQWKRMKDKKVHYRFSLINLMFGDKILYIITYDFNEKKYNLFYVLRLENIEGILLSDTKIAELENNYRNHVSNLSENDMNIEKESLCYHIQNEEQRINTSMDKLNIYMTIILTILPLLLAIIDIKKIFKLSFWGLVGVFLILYSLINICIYIFHGIKVGGITKSSFKDLKLKNEDEKTKEILVQYYFDWQQLKYKAQLYVSFVLNLQEWVIAILVISSLITIGNSIPKNFEKQNVEYIDANTVLNVDLDQITEPYSDSAKIWTKLITCIEEEQCRQVTFIINNNEQNFKLDDELDKYYNLNVKVLKDNMIEEGTLKIIVEE